MSIPEIRDLIGVDNDALVQFAQIERRLCPGSSLAAQQGPSWASLKLTALEWKCDALTALDAKVRVLAPYEGRIDWWFVAQDPGSSIAEHDHSQALWTGVYYPRGVDFRQGGEIHFPESSFLVAPYQGCLLLFEPTAKHEVRKLSAYAGTRWSLAFNIMAEGDSQ